VCACVGPLVICALVDAPSVYGEYTLYDKDMSVYSEFTLYNHIDSHNGHQLHVLLALSILTADSLQLLLVFYVLIHLMMA
jgi:hypothetical protein